MNVYLDGAFMPLADARVPVLDRGFLFGDAVYEVIPVYSRRPFRLGQHLQRLRASLAAVRIAHADDDATWQARIDTLVAQQASDDQSVYIQITRGVPGAGDPLRDQVAPAGATPTVFMFSQPLVTATAAQRAAGVGAVTAADNRWLRCDIKATSLLANVLLRQQSVDAACAETIMLRDGWLTEGSSSNIFIVSNGVILAPPPSNLMLTGVTYDLVLELAAREGIAHAVRAVAEAELRAADEIWMTSSTKEIMPIVSLDGVAVGDGAPGPLARRMDALYQAYKQDVMRT